MLYILQNQLLAFAVLVLALWMAVKLVGGGELRARNSLGLAAGVTLVYTVVELFVGLLIVKLQLPRFFTTLLMTGVVALAVMFSYQLSFARSVIIGVLMPILGDLIALGICLIERGSDGARFCRDLVF